LARSTSRAGAVLDPLNSVNICLWASDNTKGARRVSLAMFASAVVPGTSIMNSY
jgi:hypothetical protein